MTHPKPDNAPTPMGPVLSAEQFEKLQDAAKRLISVQNEVLGMPQEQQQWFFGKEGHADAFDLAWWVNIKLPQLRDLLAQRDKRLSDMEARYHNDIQCRDALLETAKATIARQVEELDRVRELCDRDNQTSGRMIWTLGQDRDALRNGLEKLIQELPKSEWFDTWMDEEDSPKIKLALAAAQAILSGMPILNK